jgi:hypothetical protein
LRASVGSTDASTSLAARVGGSTGAPEKDFCGSTRLYTFVTIDP